MPNISGFITLLSDKLPELGTFDPHAHLKTRMQPIGCTVNHGLFHSMPNVQKALSCAGKWRIHLSYSGLLVVVLLQEHFSIICMIDFHTGINSDDIHESKLQDAQWHHHWLTECCSWTKKTFRRDLLLVDICWHVQTNILWVPWWRYCEHILIGKTDANRSHLFAIVHKKWQKSMFEFHKVQRRRASGAVGKFTCVLSRI